MSDPAKFGSFLRKMIPRVDDNLEPQIVMEKLAAVYLIKSLSGEYYFIDIKAVCSGFPSNHISIIQKHVFCPTIFCIFEWGMSLGKKTARGYQCLYKTRHSVNGI